MATQIKQISELEQISKASSQTNVLVEENGKAKRLNANNIGKVKSVNGVWPDADGNVQIDISGGGAGDGGDTSATFPNPYPINFTGAATASYDGSEAVTINIPEGGKADWNQNDPEGEGYIIGRTHYTKDVIDLEVFNYIQDTPSFSRDYATNKYYHYMSTSVPNFVIGATYTVVINENQYQTIAKSKDELGNGSLDSTSAENTEEEFYFRRSYLYLNINVDEVVPTSLKVSIIQQSYAEVVPIDEKYLVNKPGKITTGLDFEIDNETWTAYDGAEIFNNPENIATGEYSHAEGDETKALDWADHAEGYSTVARGGPSHAEGDSCEAHGYASHAEGCGTFAYGDYTHAEGYETIAHEDYAHTEGYYTQAYGNYGAHAEGNYSEARGDWGSHAEGNYCVAFGNDSHAEGEYSIAYGVGSHAEGENTLSYGDYSHAEGGSSYDYDYFSITGQGKVFTVSKEINVQPGDILISNFEASEIVSYDPETLTITTEYKMTDETVEDQDASLYHSGLAGGNYSHAEGFCSKASGEASHAQGSNTVAPQACMDVTGKFNKIEYGYTITPKIGWEFNYLYHVGSFTLDQETGYFKLENVDSTAANTSTLKIGEFYTRDSSAAVNGEPVQLYTRTLYKALTEGSVKLDFDIYETGPTVQGKYVHIVGNGEADNERSNAHTLNWDGTPWYQNRPQFGGTAQDEGSQTVVANGDTEIILTSPGGVKVRITVNDDGTMNSEIVQ